MAYQTGTATNMGDLLAKLHSFATGTPSSTVVGGWTTIYTVANPQTTDGWFELNRGSLSFSIKYPIGAQAPVEHISIHQARVPNLITTAPGKHTDDSGNGYNATDTGHTNAQLDGERHVTAIGDGPFPSYHFFADQSTNDYIHVVVEATTGMYRHFQFGSLDKSGDDWVGGEYVCGQEVSDLTGTTPTDGRHCVLFDGVYFDSAAPMSATIRLASGLPNQSPAIWGVSVAHASSFGLDTAGTARRQIHGGFRAGIEARTFGNFSGNSSSGVIPMYQIAAYYPDPLNFHRKQLLGYMPDVRALNIRNFDAAQEETIDSETWIIFPMSIKTTAFIQYRSVFSGIAYKKLT